MNETRPIRAWPLVLMALPAAVAIWSGWVGLGEMAGFGLVQPLPGIVHFHLNTAITLPVGVEAYGAFALGAWLRSGTPDAARRFARWSAIGALGLGMTGQVAYHLLAAYHETRAPVPVIVIVACIPVIALGFGAALAHLLRSGGEARSEQSSEHRWSDLAAPLVTSLAARIAPREVTPDSPGIHPADDSAPHPDDHPGTHPEVHPASHPAEHPADDTESHPGESRPVTLAGVARVRRKGAVNATDEEVKTAIRELLADGNAVTPYRVKAALKGSKGGIGEGRAAKLLAEVQAERPSLSAVK